MWIGNILKFPLDYDDLGPSFKVEMDDGKDTTGAFAAGAEHNAETAFNSLPLKTTEGSVSMHP